MQLRKPWAWIILLALFCPAALLEARQLHSLTNGAGSAVWLHLNSGLWMLAHHGLIRQGVFSQHPNTAWIDVRWGYDLMVATGYQVFGLAVLPVFHMIFRFSCALLAFLLAGGGRGRFWTAVALSLAAQYLLYSTPAGPGCCSVIFLAVELLLLAGALRGAGGQTLYFLPLLFLLWANVDVQFVYGLVLFALYVLGLLAETAMSRQGWPAQPTRPALGASLVLVASLVVTLATPSFYRPYGVFLEWVSGAFNRYIDECRSLSFHRPQDYLLMLLVMGTYFALGTRRSRSLAMILPLVAATVWAFHSRRDAWLVLLLALAVFGEMAAPEQDDAKLRLSWRSVAGVAGVAAVLLLAAGAALIPHRREALLASAAKAYPVAACDYVRAQHLPQPVFNSLEWGGFLGWYLPEYPVAFDTRTELYGSEAVLRYYQLMNVELGPSEVPEFSGAETIILSKQSVMGQALVGSRGFQARYADDVAVVFTRSLQ